MSPMSQPRLRMLTLPRDAEGKLPPIHPTLVFDDRDAVLIDPGCAGMTPAVLAALRAAGLDPARLTRVVITHHDHDHMGALAALARACPRVRVAASPGQTPFIEGREKSPRLVQAEAAYDGLPEAEKPASLAFQKIAAAVEPAHVDDQLRGGDVLPCCGGMEVLDTPGHMPGHLSLFVRARATLVAGDALTAEAGRLGPPNPHFTMDMPAALASLRRLAGRDDIRRVICHHGGMVEGDIRQAILDALTQAEGDAA